MLAHLTLHCIKSPYLQLQGSIIVVTTLVTIIIVLLHYHYISFISIHYHISITYFININYHSIVYQCIKSPYLQLQSTAIPANRENVGALCSQA